MIILKILLIILLSLLVLLAFILFLHIHIKVSFSEELALEVRLLFVKLRILPQKEKKKNKREKKAKKEKKKKEKKKKPPEKEEDTEPKPKRSILKEKGLSGFLKMLKELVTLSSSRVFYLLSKTKVKKVEIRLSYAGKDAAQTAIGYGRCCSIVYPAAAFIVDKTVCKAYSVEVVPNFDEEAKTEISALLICRVRIIRIFITALKFLAGYIKLKIKGIV